MQVSITIRGRQYTVRGDDSPEDVEAVARDLDNRLEEVAGRTRSFDEYTIAMMTALNLASRLDIDVAQAVRDKIAFNAERYPVALSKGRAVKYNALKGDD